MIDPNEPPFADTTPDRPLECSECRKPIEVLYTEIVGKVITQTGMCNDCPCLQKKLKGIAHANAEGSYAEGGTGIACGECGTTLDAIRVGHPMGCPNCYEVFSDVIFNELIVSERIPSRLNNVKKTSPIHIGRAPGESREISPSLRLLALNDALSETLKREDYEQAALLRDQIRALTERTKEEGEHGK